MARPRSNGAGAIIDPNDSRFSGAPPAGHGVTVTFVDRTHAMAAADRNLLFGLLALQNGLIDQVQLVGGFQAWTRDKSKSLAEHLESLGGLTSAKRALLEQLALAHLEAHGGSVENSLAAISAGPSARESLTTIKDSQVDTALYHVVSTLNGQDPFDQPATLSIGAATSEGQRFRNPSAARSRRPGGGIRRA